MTYGPGHDRGRWIDDHPMPPPRSDRQVGLATLAAIVFLITVVLVIRALLQ